MALVVGNDAGTAAAINKLITSTKFRSALQPSSHRQTKMQVEPSPARDVLQRPAERPHAMLLQLHPALQSPRRPALLQCKCSCRPTPRPRTPVSGVSGSAKTWATAAAAARVANAPRKQNWSRSMSAFCSWVELDVLKEATRDTVVFRHSGIVRGRVAFETSHGMA